LQPHLAGANSAPPIPWLDLRGRLKAGEREGKGRKEEGRKVVKGKEGMREKIPGNKCLFTSLKHRIEKCG